MTGTTIPLEAWKGLQVSTSLKRPEFIQCAHEILKVVGLTPHSPGKYPLYSFMLEAESTPGS